MASKMTMTEVRIKKWWFLMKAAHFRFFNSKITESNLKWQLLVETDPFFTQNDRIENDKIVWMILSSIFTKNWNSFVDFSSVFTGLVVKCAYGKYDLSEYVSLDTKIGINETRFYWFMINCYPLWLIYHLSLIICKIMTSKNSVGNRDPRAGQDQDWKKFQCWVRIRTCKISKTRTVFRKMVKFSNLVWNRDPRAGQNQYWKNFKSWSGLGLAKFPNLGLYSEKW